MQFRFLGAPMITEPIEFGHKAFPVYTTMRDLGYSFFSALVIGAGIYALNKWIGLLAVFMLLLIFLFVTQRLRKAFGNAWPWELVHRGRSTADKKGYLGGGRRCHTASMTDSPPRFLVGDDQAIQAIRHRTEVLSPFAKYRSATRSVAGITRTASPLSGFKRE